MYRHLDRIYSTAIAIVLVCMPASSIGQQFWSADAGSVTLMLHHQPLENLSVFIADAEIAASSRGTFSTVELAVQGRPGLWFEVIDRSVSGLFGRDLQAAPGLEIVTPSGEHTVFDLTLRHEGLLGSDAAADFGDEPPGLVLHDIKTGFDANARRLKVFSRRVVISPTLADVLGDPELTGLSVGTAMITFDAHWVSGDQPPAEEPADLPAGAGSIGPDVTFCQLYDLRQFGRLDDIVGLSVATTSWNVGDEPLDWYGSPNPAHPFIIMNLFRLRDDRLEQIGQSWIKHGFCALDNAQCAGTCAIHTGCNTLSPGCTDTYGSGLNAIQSGLGPRHEVIPWTGEWFDGDSHFSQGRPSHDPVEHRIEVRDADLNPAQNLGATYYVESYYPAHDDVDVMNSVAWKPVTPSIHPTNPDLWVFEMTNNREYPNIGFAIDSWTGAEQTILAQAVPPIEFVSPDGRCILATKASLLPGGGYHYEYALLNIDMNRKVGTFSIPLRSEVSITNIGFHAVESYGEPYSNDPWLAEVTDDAITWTTDSNPLCWGTLYNFRFDANLPPGEATVTLGLYEPAEPGEPDVVTGTTQGPTMVGPQIVHGAAGVSFHARGFSGYIDPCRESSDGTNVNAGLTDVTIRFSEPVVMRGGGELTANAFAARETGDLLPPNVVAISTTDNQTVTVVLDRIITLQEWTTIRCKVQNLDGVPILNMNDLGPGRLEPDRIDVGFLPGDVDQDGRVIPTDLMVFRQYIFGGVPLIGIGEDYTDMNRDGQLSPIDLIRFRQLLSGTAPATKSWTATLMNHAQP